MNCDVCDYIVIFMDDLATVLIHSMAWLMDVRPVSANKQTYGTFSQELVARRTRQPDCGPVPSDWIYSKHQVFLAIYSNAYL